MRGLEPLTSGLQSPRSAKLSYTPFSKSNKQYQADGISQSEYPAWWIWGLRVGLRRFELLTSRLSGVRSNQLSYRPRTAGFYRKIKPLGFFISKWLVYYIIKVNLQLVGKRQSLLATKFWQFSNKQNELTSSYDNNCSCYKTVPVITVIQESKIDISKLGRYTIRRKISLKEREI